MAPNVPSDQRDDALHCWAWDGAVGGVGGGKDGGAVEMERDRGPPPPPPPLQAPPSPLTPVTANNVIANMNPKSLKRQTAIVNHKTAAANKASPASTSPSSKRLKLDHSPSPKTGLCNNNNNNNNAKSSTSLCAALRHQPQRCCTVLHNHQKAQCMKPGKGDAKGRSLGGAMLQTDMAAHAKLQQQGKITEYFKTQMKPMNGAKKDLAAKTGSSEFRSPVSQMVCRKSASDVKTDRNSSGGLDKYFNINSGTQPAATVPLLKVPEMKDLAGSNLPVATSVQTLSWNSKCDVMDCNSRSPKTAQKVNEKKMNVAASTPAHKELPAPATSLKIPEVKKNGLVSPSLSSQKLSALLLPPPSTQNDTSSPSTFSPNLPESTSCTSQLVTPEVSEIVCNLPKPDSLDETDVLLEKEVLASSTPVGKASSILEDSAVSTSGDQSESVASIASDSGLSISVSSSSPAPSSLPSPILSVPRTIRFPAVDCSQSNVSKSATIDQSDSTMCRWSECNSHFESSTILLEHLQAKHVNTQGMCETFVCLWVGCKVYARTSCSRSWLERHVLSHGGNKPFRCIVDGCGLRFSSQTTLERHVNSHFNQSESGNSNAGTRRSVESSTNKLFRRNGKRLRLRRQPWSARMFDYFDSGIMEGLQHRLMNMTEKRTLGDVASAPGNTISLHSKVMARRIEPSGKIKVLLRWYPEDIVDDEWVLEADIRRTQTVPISQLSSAAVEPLHNALFASASCSASSSSSTSNSSPVSVNVATINSPGCSSSCSSTTTTRRRPRKQGKPAS